jgi:hypothetical protein
VKALAQSWTSQSVAIVLPMATAERLCLPRPRRGGVVATFARRDRLAARLVVWAPGVAGGAHPVGTIGIEWRTPGAGEATLSELSWPPTGQATDLWQAIEDLAGRPIPR